MLASKSLTARYKRGRYGQSSFFWMVRLLHNFYSVSEKIIYPIWPNPLPVWFPILVGRRIVISLLGRLWANLRVFECLKESQSKYCFLSAHIQLPNCPVCLAGWFFYVLAFVCLFCLLPCDTEGLNVPKVSVQNVSGKSRTGGSDDTSYALWRVGTYGAAHSLGVIMHWACPN